MDFCGCNDIGSESDVDEPTPMVTEQQLHKKLTSCFSNTSEMAISPHRSLQKICNIVGYFMTRGSSSLLREDLSVATLETGLIMFEHVLNYLRYTLEVHYESFKPINELRLDRLRAQIRAIDDRRHSLQRPDNEEEAKERSARLCVYIDDIEYVLQNPATRTKSSKLHMNNGGITGNVYPTITKPKELYKVAKVIKKMQFGYTSFDDQNLPLQKTERVFNRQDLVQKYKFGDCCMEPHTLILFVRLLLGPACDIRLAIMTITELRQYNKLIELLDFCNFIFHILKNFSADQPMVYTAYLDYLDEMRLLTSYLYKQCKRVHIKFRLGRPLITTEQAIASVLSRVDAVSKSASNKSQKLELTTSPLLNFLKNNSENDAASFIKNSSELNISVEVADSNQDYGAGNNFSDITNFNRKSIQSTNAEAYKIDESDLGASNLLQLNDCDEEAEYNKDFEYNPKHIEYAASISCRCGQKKCLCFSDTLN